MRRRNNLLVIVKTTLTTHAIMNVCTNIHPTATCRMYNHDYSHKILFYYIYSYIIMRQNVNYPRISCF